MASVSRRRRVQRLEREAVRDDGPLRLAHEDHERRARGQAELAEPASGHWGESLVAREPVREPGPVSLKMVREPGFIA